METVDSEGGVVGRSGRAWRAADAPPTDDDLDPPHEVILPELPSTLINLSTTFTSLRLVYSGVLGVTREPSVSFTYLSTCELAIACRPGRSSSITCS